MINPQSLHMPIYITFGKKKPTCNRQLNKSTIIIHTFGQGRCQVTKSNSGVIYCTLVLLPIAIVINLTNLYTLNVVFYENL